MPSIKLPEVRLPEGLRDMSREDIQRALSDVRLPRREDLPKNVELPTRIELGDIRLPNIDLSRIDLSKVELPAALEQRIPGRRRRRNPLPFVLVGLAAIAAAVWLVVASPLAPRIRRALEDVRARLAMSGAEYEEIDEFEAEIESGRTGIDVYESATPGTLGESRTPVGVGPGPGSDPFTQSTSDAPSTDIYREPERTEPNV